MRWIVAGLGALSLMGASLAYADDAAKAVQTDVKQVAQEGAKAEAQAVTQAEGAKAVAQAEGSKAVAQAEGSKAVAQAEGAKAVAQAEGTKATAQVAQHDDKQVAQAEGSKAVAQTDVKQVAQAEGKAIAHMGSGCCSGGSRVIRVRHRHGRR
jgi:hypothetical protein